MNSEGIILKILNDRRIKYGEVRGPAPAKIQDLSALRPGLIAYRLKIALRSGRLSHEEMTVIKSWLDPSYKPPSAKPKVLVRF